MTDEPKISLAFDRLLWEDTTKPHAPETPEEGRSLELTVIFTHMRATELALERAAELARDLNGRIRLLVPQVVPFPLPLASPPVLIEFNERRFRSLAANASIETRVEIYLCRDADDLLTEKLTPKSIIVIAARKSWWPAAEKGLARKLRRRGHEVVFAYTERAKDA